MIKAVLMLLAAQTASASPSPLPAQLADEAVDVFVRFCVSTRADRELFDTAVEKAVVTKTSRPSLFSGVEFNRRWTIGDIKLAYMDAPPPTGRYCSVSFDQRGGFDAATVKAALARRVSGPISLIEGDESNFAIWRMSDVAGGTLTVLNRPNPNGFGGIELSLRPTSQPTWDD